MIFLRMAGLLRLIPMLVCMATIFILSHQPGSTHEWLFHGADKIAHLVVYAVLSGTVIYAFSAETRRRNRGVVLIAALLVPILFGLSDEYHQSWIPGRTSEFLDLVADAAGGLVAAFVWLIFISDKQ